MCIARVFLFANFMVVAASIPVIIDDWGLSAAQAGSIVSSFTVCYAVSLFGLSWLADHFGAKRVTVASAWAAAAAALAFGLFARDFTSAFLLYGLAGLTQGGTYTPVIMLFADRFPPRWRGSAVGWLIGSTSIGYAASLAVSGLAIGLGGWQAAFIASGILPIAGAILLTATLRDTANVIHPRTASGALRNTFLARSDGRRLVVGYTAHSWELLGMWAWMPTFITTAAALGGFAAASATGIGAYISAAGHIIGAVASLTMGGLSDRLGRKAVLVGMAAISAVLSLTIGWLVWLPLVILAVLALVYSFSAIGDSAVLSTALTEAVPPGSLGSVLAIRSLLGFGAGAIAPLVFGAILDATGDAADSASFSWGMAFASLGVGGIIATACAVRLGRPMRP